MRAALALAALLAGNAYAEAIATADIFNRSPNLLTRADGTTSVIDGNSAVLRVGDTLSFSFEYRLEVRDDGLPVSDATRASWILTDNQASPMNRNNNNGLASYMH